MTVLFGVVLVLALWVAVESGHALAGGDSHLLPVDYRSAWADADGWNPSDAVRLTVFAAVGVLGVLLVLSQLMSRQRRRIEVSTAGRGVALLDARGLSRHISRQIADEDWIVSTSPQFAVSGRVVDVIDRPTASRPWTDDDLGVLRENVARGVRTLGLEPGDIRLSPRMSRRAARRTGVT